MPDFSDSSSVLFDYFSKNASNKYELVWLISDKNNKQKKGITKCIHREDEDFEDSFNSIDIIFSTHNLYINYKKKYQTWITLWHGINLKNLGLFVDSDEVRQWVDATSSKIDYFVMTSRYTSSVFSTSFNVPYDSFLEFGQPRCDKLKSSIDARKNLSSVLNGIDLSGIKKIIFYLPTFKSGIGRNEGFINKHNFLNCEEYEESILDNYLKENKYIMVTKPHPLEESVVSSKKSSSIFKIKDSELLDLNLTLYDIVSSCDLLVTDYSSISFDLLTVNKPMLYIHTDFEDYVQKRGIVFDDYELWFPGPRVSLIEDFIKESGKLLKDESYYAKERLRTNRVVNGKYKFDACKKILGFVNYKIYKNISAMERRVEKVLEENEKLKKHNEKLVSQECMIAEENKRLSSKLKEVENSRSWKMTKPTRDAVSIIRKINKSI